MTARSYRRRSADERAHPPGADPWWAETWAFDFTATGDDGGLRSHVRLTVLPNQRVCWYLAVVSGVIGMGPDPLAVVDPDVPPPRPPGLEIRTEGLWADHIVEEAFEHVSVGCEAFALRVDQASAAPIQRALASTSPSDALGAATEAARLVGDRIPFGLDLGWETEGPVSPASDGEGYLLPCRVVGEVLVADERIVLDLPGTRLHLWSP